MECKVKENSKLHLYDRIKHIFEKEKYLDDVSTFKMRKVISKFRCSDHKLEIEVGRHKKGPRDERYCKFSPKEIETESHFLSFCPTYQDLRVKFFNQKRIDTGQEQDILGCKIRSVTINLGLYIEKAFKIRESLTYASNEHDHMLKQLLEKGFSTVE